MLNALDQYLTDEGFVPFVRAGIANRPETWKEIPDPNPGFYSSVQAFPGSPYFLRRKWVKDGVEVHTGLNEAGLPPTLVWPRPRIKPELVIVDGMVRYISKDRDAVINGLIHSIGPAKVLEAAFDQSILLEC